MTGVNQRSQPFSKQRRSITHLASTLAGLGRDDEMTMGPREVVASDGQVSEPKLTLGSEALYHGLSQELLNHTAPSLAIQPARPGRAHAAILAT